MLLVLAAPLWAAPPRSAGVYDDDAGRSHPWWADANAALHFDGRLFFPVGGMFCFRHLSEYDPKDAPGNESRFREDSEILERVWKAGVRHLYVNPVNPATRFPANVWNRCMEELERLGFTYGIEITDGPREGMDGYLLGGSSWKTQATAGGLRIDWQAEFDGTPLLQELIAVARDGSSQNVPVERSRSTSSVIALPENLRNGGTIVVPRIVAPKGFNVPDLWSGYDEYEARLLALLSGLRKGAGLRFILDPFTNEMNYHGYTAHIVPASAVFRDGYAAWLEAKFRGDLGALARAWRAKELPAGWRECARLLPVPVSMGEVEASRLVSASPGGKTSAPGWLLDPETGRCWAADAAASGALEDLRRYREAAVAAYCARISAAIRGRFADLPIVFKHTGRLARFLILRGPQRGFDGIGIEAWGANAAEIVKTAGPPLAVIKQWDRPGWLPVTETAPSPEPAGKLVGYPSQEAMFAHLDTLLGMGARGFYLFAIRPLPEEPLPDYCLYRDARQLGWIAAYEKALASLPRAARLQRRPRVLYRDAGPGATLQARGWLTGGGPATPFSELAGKTLVLPGIGSP